MDAENPATLSSLPISGRAKRTRVKDRTSVVHKGKSKRSSASPAHDILSPVVSIFIHESFPSCEQLTKKRYSCFVPFCSAAYVSLPSTQRSSRSRDMLNYDVGWTDDCVTVTQSIEVEGQDNLTLHADRSETQPVIATKTRKGRKRKVTHVVEVEEQEQPILQADKSAPQVTTVLPEAKTRKRRKRDLSQSVVVEGLEDSNLHTELSAVQAAEVLPVIKTRKGRKRAKVFLPTDLEAPVVRRDSSSRRSFKWTPEQVRHV